MLISFKTHLRLLRISVAALLFAASLAGAMQAPAANTDDDATGELIGELMFRADLLQALDAMCPRGGSVHDWHAALPTLPADATTPELLELSRQLGADAGQELVRESGGCRTRGFVAAYEESRRTFGELIERWRGL